MMQSIPADEHGLTLAPGDRSAGICIGDETLSLRAPAFPGGTRGDYIYVFFP